jgi:hypothetical protein
MITKGHDLCNRYNWMMSTFFKVDNNNSKHFFGPFQPFQLSGKEVSLQYITLMICGLKGNGVSTPFLF